MAVKLKVNLALGEKMRRQLGEWRKRPWAGTALLGLKAAAAGFLLSGVSVVGLFLPLSVSLTASLGLGVPAFAAYAGGSLGYCLFWGLGTALEPVAAGLLVTACACIWGDQDAGKNQWFEPMSAAVFTALVGVLFLVEKGLSLGTLLPYLLRIAVAGGGTVLFQRLRTKPDAEESADSGERQSLAACLLEQISLCLTRTRPDQPDPETAAVFDQAAERVCRLCSLWDDCWGENIDETCDALNRAAPAMMGRGKALREDLPALFTGRCRHLEGFLNAVNRELDDLSCRRQYRSRLKESRAVLAEQYHALSAALARGEPPEPTVLRFQAEVGCRSQGRRGDSLSGDKGASFQKGQWFYVLLCDGMGTGPGAAAEAGAAIAIVETLLRSGVTPPEALRTLNGIYILRDDGCFATVDLVQANLMTGETAVYKWGAAPSYLKRRDSVERIGTASPPPGIGVGEAHQPVGARLSLSEGEMLVLVSDGAGGEAAERAIRQYGGLSTKELASSVIGCSQSQGEDDRTAVVLALRPFFSQ